MTIHPENADDPLFEVDVALAEIDNIATGRKGMQVPYHGLFCAALRLPSFARDLRRVRDEIRSALDARDERIAALEAGLREARRLRDDLAGSHRAAVDSIARMVSGRSGATAPDRAARDAVVEAARAWWAIHPQRPGEGSPFSRDLWDAVDALRAAPSPRPEARETGGMGYHPDPEIADGIRAEANAAEAADLAAGYAPRRWTCADCGASHSRGHLGSIGVHRCLRCGYVGDGGMMDTPERGEFPIDTAPPAPDRAARDSRHAILDAVAARDERIAALEADLADAGKVAP